MSRIREENLGELVKGGLGVEDAMSLQSISRGLHRRDEASCNGFQTWKGEWDEAADKRNDKAVEELEKKAEEIAKKYGMIAFHQSDPRGWSLYLVRPEQLGQYTIDAVYDRGLGVAIK